MPWLFVSYQCLCLPWASRENFKTRGRPHLPPPRRPPSCLPIALHGNISLSTHPPPPYTPNIFNYIFYQIVQLSSQGADIDACADKSTNTGNKINKDFEERVTANFAQWFGALFKTDVFDRASHA